MAGAPPDDRHNWIQNSTGNVGDGQWYYTEAYISPSGVGGSWHIYDDNHKVFVPSAPSPAPAAPPIAADGGIVAPAPAPIAAAPPAPTPTAPAPTAAPPPDPTQLDQVSTAVSAAALAQPASNTGGLLADSTDSGSTSRYPTQLADADQQVEGAMSAGSDSQAADSTSSSDSVAATPLRGTMPAQALHNDTNGLASALNDAVQNGGGAYVVTAGDTMSGIAAAHGMSLTQLESLNPAIKNPDFILPGQQISLGTAAAPAATADGCAAAFPTTSTYQNAGVVPAVDTNPNPQGLGGWSDGTGTVAKDPTQGIVAAAPAVQTDPLKIDKR
jgi:LysM repeat protein